MMMKPTRVLAFVCVIAASPVAAQTSKVDRAVAGAFGQIDKAQAASDPAVQLKLFEDALKNADKLIKEGTPEALLGASAIQARAGKLELAAATADQALQGAAEAPAALQARLFAHAAGLHILRGTSKDALELARRADLAQSTSDTLAVLALAQAHIRDAQAVASAEKAVAAAPPSAVAHDALGHALAVAGQLKEAEAALDKALSLDPRLYRAHIHRAQLLLAAGRPAEAVTAAQAATQLAPQHGIGFAVLGAAMVAQDPTTASKAINEVASGGILAEDHSPYISFVRGEILTLQGRYEEAAAAHKRALEIDPGHRAARLALIKAQLRRKEYDQVFETARTLAEENPDDGEAQAIYGELLFRKQDYAAALGPLENAARLLPRRAEAHAMLGKAYHFNGEVESAAKAYAHAVELAPDNLDHHIQYGLFLGMSGQTDAGAAEIEKAVKSPGYTGADGHINLGYVYANADPRRPAEAAAAYGKAVEIAPKNAQAWLGLGRAQLYAKKYDDATQALARVPGLDPKLTCEALVTQAAVHIQVVAEAKVKDATAARQAIDAVRASCANDPRIARLEEGLKNAMTDGVAAPPVDGEPKPTGPTLGDVVAELRSPTARVRTAGARKMAAFGAEAVPYLVPVINTDSDVGVRTAVAKALGAIGAAASSACGPLQKEIADSNERVVLPPPSSGKPPTAEEESQRFARERALQNACKEGRARIGCK
jgi:tetratricopeptide (TPR) repeat protein